MFFYTMYLLSLSIYILIYLSSLLLKMLIGTTILSFTGFSLRSRLVDEKKRATEGWMDHPSGAPRGGD